MVEILARLGITMNVCVKHVFVWEYVPGKPMRSQMYNFSTLQTSDFTQRCKSCSDCGTSGTSEHHLFRYNGTFGIKSPRMFAGVLWEAAYCYQGLYSGPASKSATPGNRKTSTFCKTFPFIKGVNRPLRRGARQPRVLHMNSPLAQKRDMAY